MFTAFLRSLVAGLFLLIIAIVLKRPFPRATKHWLLIVAIALSATSIGFWGMFYAGSLISPGLATVLTNTQPLIAGLLGWYFLKESLNKRAIIGILVGFFGVFIISTESLLLPNSQASNGLFYALVAALGVAISNILLKKLANQADVFYAMGFQLLIGAIPLGLLSFYFGELPSFQFSLAFGWILLALALLGTALPFTLWFWLMSKAPLYQLNIFSFLNPVFGLFLGYVYFSESLSIYQYSGIAFIIFSVYLVATTQRK